MERIRLRHLSDDYFHDAWKIYQDAFPLEERRILDAQKKVMKNENYHFDIICDGNHLIGFLLWWDLDTHRYIDHFATSKEQRNKGYGKLILESFMAFNDKPILLEVELPNSTINQRRIKFYERSGFKFNQHHYELPAFKKGELPLELKLMSFPDHLNKVEVELFKKISHPIIFEQ